MATLDHDKPENQHSVTEIDYKELTNLEVKIFQNSQLLADNI